MAVWKASALNLVHSELYLRKTLCSMNKGDVSNPPRHPPLSRKDQAMSLKDEGTSCLCGLLPLLLLPYTLSVSLLTAQSAAPLYATSQHHRVPEM